MSESQHGLALLCDASGRILEVLRNDLNVPDVAAGHLFLRLADGASRSKVIEVGIQDSRCLLHAGG